MNNYDNCIIRTCKINDHLDFNTYMISNSIVFGIVDTAEDIQFFVELSDIDDIKKFFNNFDEKLV